MAGSPAARRGVAAAILVMIAAAFVAWWLLRDGALPRASDPVPSPSAAPGASTVGPASPRRAAPVGETGDAQAASDEPPPEPEVVEVRTLLVHDADGRPVPGAGVLFREKLRRTDSRGLWTWTRRRGEPDISPQVRVVRVDGGLDVTLSGPETRADIGRLPTLEVLVMDPVTGATWAPDAAIVRFDGSDDLWCDPASSIPIPIARRGQLIRIEATPVTGESRACATVTATAGETHMRGGVRAVAVAWPARSATVKAVELDGSPVPGATIESIVLDDNSPDGRIIVRAQPADASGVITLGGVPTIPGATAWVVVKRHGDRPGESRALLDLSPDGAAATTGTWISDPDVGGSWSTAIGIGGGGEPVRPVRVRILREDGSPAPGVSVGVRGLGAKRSDEEGFALLDAAASDTLTLRASGYGITTTFSRVAVPASGEVTITERSARLRVAVIDALGRPVAGAALLARSRGIFVDGADALEPAGNAWEWQWHGSALDLAPRTDANGRITLRVPRGTMDIEAWRGSVAATAEVTSWPEPESEVTLRLDK